MTRLPLRRDRDTRPSAGLALTVLVAGLGWTWTASLAAQDHAPSAKHAEHDATAHETEAPAKKAASPPPRGGDELDAVMQRINRRIAATAGKTAPASGAASRPDVAAAEAHGGPKPAAGGRAASSAGRASHATAAPAPAAPRVRLTWRPTVVWPRAVLAVLDDADGRVEVAWAPVK